MTTTYAPDDATLVRGVAVGDAGALGAVFDRYAGRLLGFCQSMLRRPADAEECLQDIFTIAATRLGDLREPALLRSWLFSVARFECLERLDQRRREVPVEAMIDPAAAAADTRFDAELATLMDESADGRSDRDRLLLELADRQQLSGDELADAIGVHRSTAYTALARARANTRASVGALLVARTGRDRCPALAGVLGRWDGQPATLPRKQVDRHIQSCAACTEQRDRVVTPDALLGDGTEIAFVPTAARERILAAATSAAAVASSAASSSAAAGSPAAAGGGPGPDGVGVGELGSAVHDSDDVGADGLGADGLGADVLGADWMGGDWPPADGAFLVADSAPRRWVAPVVVLAVLLLALGVVLGLLAMSGGGSTPAASVITRPTAVTTTASSPTIVTAPGAGTTAAPETTPGPPLGAAAPPAVKVVPTPTLTPTPTPTSTSSAPGGVFTLSITTNANIARISSGSSSVQCGPVTTCTYQVAADASVSITATPIAVAAGSATTFSAPGSCANSNTGICSFTMTKDLRIVLSVTTRRGAN